MSLLGLAFALILEAAIGVYHDSQYLPQPQDAGTVHLQETPTPGGE